MTRRPNYTNEHDACCSCGKLYPTPKDHEAPAEGELSVWQPDSHDPPQWICAECRGPLEEQARRY